MQKVRPYEIRLERYYDGRVKVSYDRTLLDWPRDPPATDRLKPSSGLPALGLNLSEVRGLMQTSALGQRSREDLASLGETLGELLFPEVDDAQWNVLHAQPTDIALLCDERPALANGHAPLLRWLPWHLASWKGRPLQSTSASVRILLPLDAGDEAGEREPSSVLSAPRVLARIGVDPCPSGRSRLEILKGLRLASGSAGPERLNLEEQGGRPAEIVARLISDIATGAYDVLLFHTPAVEANFGQEPALQIREDGGGAGLLPISKLAGALKEAARRRGGLTPVLHIHAPSSSIPVGPLFEALSPLVLSLGWTCARWAPRPKRTWLRGFLSPAEPAGVSLHPGAHGISGYLEHLLSGDSPPRAQARAFGYEAIEKGLSLCWSRYPSWPGRGTSTVHGFYRPSWIARMNRERQHARVIGALQLGLQEHWAWAPVFLWSGEASQEPETFHQRIEVELETWADEYHSEFDIDEAGIEWPMDAQLNVPADAPHAQDDRVFQRRLEAEYRAALGHPITPEGLNAFLSDKRTTGSALLLYLHHTFYSHRFPSEGEIGQLLRWWEGSLLSAMPDRIFPILGISWVLGEAEPPADRAPDMLLKEEGRLVQTFQNGGVKVWPLARLKQINVDHLQHFFERVGWPEGWPEDPATRRAKAEQLITDAARAGQPPGASGGPLSEHPSLHADWRAVADLLGGLRPQRPAPQGPQPTGRRRARRPSP